MFSFNVSLYNLNVGLVAFTASSGIPHDIGWYTTHILWCILNCLLKSLVIFAENFRISSKDISTRTPKVTKTRRKAIHSLFEPDF